MQVFLKALESRPFYDGCRGGLVVLGGTGSLRTLSAISSAFILTLACPFSAQAEDRPDAERHEIMTAPASTGGGVFVELIAEDFYESSLRLSQARRIEAETARRYLALDEAGRARFRAARKRQWREMSEAERQALRDAKRPRFDNLDETQKQTFRRIAAETLGAGDLAALKANEI